ncbi:hypothetical protein BTO32_15135 [Marinobacter lutaoensis]|uniref:TNase-like domain-containing protein n=1 Tax=Marinobacter lutaoensis TaxID=135739 RepID=A0A1V2DPV9_9GAMM|nr:thermonuclease family protein [Marinobacter lutaoensis]ONF42540.1 hypothetical protein BTO32_15135 [Marinobacter lutaoensis]
MPSKQGGRKRIVKPRSIRWIAGIACFVMFATSSLAIADTSTDFHVRGKATVHYVIDGDTAILRVSDATTWKKLRDLALDRQRFTGRKLNINRNFSVVNGYPEMKVRIGMIQTPESVHPDKDRITKAGIIASQFAKSVFQGDHAYFECWDIGYYGRPICSVRTPDGDWGKVMIKNGHSTYWTKYGTHPFDHEGYLAAARAR